MAAQDDFDDLWASFEKKSHCYTVKNKYPRTTNNYVYIDWSRSPFHVERHNYYKDVLAPCEPGPPWRRFRPLPPIKHAEEDRQLRVQILGERAGLRTPEDSLHLGYKGFSMDALKKKFRHHNDPIPYPLATEKRFAYQSPQKDRGHMLVPDVNYSRYGLSPYNFAFGIAPEILSIPPEFPSGPPRKVL